MTRKMMPLLGALILCTLTCVLAQTNGWECGANNWGSTKYIMHVDVSLSDSVAEPQWYPGVFFYDFANRRIRLSYTPNDISEAEVNEWTFYERSEQVRTCLADCGLFPLEPERNLFPVLFTIDEAAYASFGGIDREGGYCRESSADSNIIEAKFYQFDPSSTAAEREMEIDLTIHKSEGVQLAKITYLNVTEDNVRIYRFLNTTNLLDTPDFPADTWTPPDACNPERNETYCGIDMDLVFLLDASASISTSEFTQLLNFVTEVVSPDRNIVDIASDRSRGGIITFSINATIWLPLTSDANKFTDTVDALHHYNENFRTGSLTNLTAAIVAGREIFQDSPDEAYKIVVLVSDGVQTVADGTSPEEEAELLQATDGVLLLVIAVGDSQDVARLEGIAIDGQFFDPTSFDAIGNEIGDLIPALCNYNYTRPCGGCAGLCFCSNECVEAPTPPTMAPPTLTPDAPSYVCPVPFDEDPVHCCPDDNGVLYEFDCLERHQDVVDLQNSTNETCYVITCPHPSDVPSLIDNNGNVLPEAECNVTRINDASICEIIVFPPPSGSSTPVIGIAIGVALGAIVVAIIAFGVWRMFSGGAAAAGGDVVSIAPGAGANTSGAFQPRANVNENPL